MATPPAAAAARPEWRRNLQGGLLIGLIVTAAEVSSQPTAVTPLATQAGFAIVLGILFILSAAVLALTMPPLAARVRAPTLVAAFVALCTALGAVMMITIDRLVRVTPDLQQTFSTEPDRFAIFLHTLFPLLVFGGMGLTGYLLWRRANRARAFIAGSLIAAVRAETEIVADATRDLRGQIRPDDIADIIGEIRRRYRVQVQAGDRLLDRLTEFLRAAMPAIRTGRSTLGAEMDILARYELLLRGRGHPPRWRLLRRRPLPEGLAFPPLLLMQVVDSLPPRLDPPVELRFGQRGGLVVVEIHDPLSRLAADWLDPALVERLRLGLSTLHADGDVATAAGPFPFQLRFGPAAPAHLDLPHSTGTHGR